MQEVLVNRLGGLNLPRKSVVRLTDCPDMTLDVYRGRKTTTTIHSASATLQAYASNSSAELLSYPSANISHLFGEGNFMTLV